MTYSLILGCPRCNQYKALSTTNLSKIRFKCHRCGMNTTRKYTSKFGNHNFKVGYRAEGESESDCVKRMNGRTTR